MCGGFEVLFRARCYFCFPFSAGGRQLQARAWKDERVDFFVFNVPEAVVAANTNHRSGGTSVPLFEKSSKIL